MVLMGLLDALKKLLDALKKLLNGLRAVYAPVPDEDEDEGGPEDQYRVMAPAGLWGRGERVVWTGTSMDEAERVAATDDDWWAESDCDGEGFEPF